MRQLINIAKYIIKYIAFVASLSFSCFAQNLPGVQNNFNNYVQNNLQEESKVCSYRQAGLLLQARLYGLKFMMWMV